MDYLPSKAAEPIAVNHLRPFIFEKWLKKNKFRHYSIISGRTRSTDRDLSPPPRRLHFSKAMRSRAAVVLPGGAANTTDSSTDTMAKRMEEVSAVVSATLKFSCADCVLVPTSAGYLFRVLAMKLNSFSDSFSVGSGLEWPCRFFARHYDLHEGGRHHC